MKRIIILVMLLFALSSLSSIAFAETTAEDDVALLRGAINQLQEAFEEDGPEGYDYPDDVAGLGFTEGQKGIYVSLVNPTEARKKEIAQLSGQPDRITFHTVRYSHNELEDLEKTILEDPENPVSTAFYLIYAGERPDENYVHIEVDPAYYDAAVAYNTKYGDKVHIVVGEPIQLVDDIVVPDPPATGDTATLWGFWLAGIAIVAMTISVLMRRKRKV